MSKIYNYLDFEKYINTLSEDTYLVRWRFWYDFEGRNASAVENVILDIKDNVYMWEYDWWEGQQNIELVWIVPLQDIVGVQVSMIDDTI